MSSFFCFFHLLHKIFIVYLAYFVPNCNLAKIFHKIIQLSDVTYFLVLLILDYVATLFSRFIELATDSHFLSLK